MIVFGVSNTVEMHMYIAWNETTSDHHPFRRCLSLQIRRCGWTKTRGWTIRAHSIKGYFHISGPQGKAGWPNGHWWILPLNWSWKEVRPEGDSNEVDSRLDGRAGRSKSQLSCRRPQCYRELKSQAHYMNEFAFAIKSSSVNFWPVIGSLAFIMLPIIVRSPWSPSFLRISIASVENYL